MRNKLCTTVAISLFLQLGAANAQSDSNLDRPEMAKLSVEQQSRLGDLITKDAGMPLAAGKFQVAVGNIVPTDVQVRSIPGGAAEAAPQMKGQSYVVVEEQIAIVDPRSRKITAVLQRAQTGR